MFIWIKRLNYNFELDSLYVLKIDELTDKMKTGIIVVLLHIIHRMVIFVDNIPYAI